MENWRDCRTSRHPGQKCRDHGQPDQESRNPRRTSPQRPAQAQAEGSSMSGGIVIANEDIRAVKACTYCASAFTRPPWMSWKVWEQRKCCSMKCARAKRSSDDIANRPDIAFAFSRWVAVSDGCWSWSGALDKDGYGIFNYAGKTYRASVVALQLDGRPVPRGMYACHTCDNPTCVRPDHLYPGTPTQNMADAIERGRLKPRKLTADQVRQIRRSEGTQQSIADRFNVSAFTVASILKRKTWRHVE